MLKTSRVCVTAGCRRRINGNFDFPGFYAALIRCETTSHSYIPYPTAFPYGNGMVLHFYQQQESSTTKTVHKVINKGLKTYV